MADCPSQQCSRIGRIKLYFLPVPLALLQRPSRIDKEAQKGMHYSETRGHSHDRGRARTFCLTRRYKSREVGVCLRRSTPYPYLYPLTYTPSR